MLIKCVEIKSKKLKKLFNDVISFEMLNNMSVIFVATSCMPTLLHRFVVPNGIIGVA